MMQGTIQARPPLARSRWLVAMLVALVAGVSLLTAAPAQAISPMDDYPYEHSDMPRTDPWGFSKGDATSFVAWRLTGTNGYSDFKNTLTRGAVTEKFGSAHNWQFAAINLGFIYDAAPGTGSVAWWPKNYHGADTPGHVAWVHRVNGDGTITVEEYNNAPAPNEYRYSLRTINLSGADAPSGFIHFRDVPAMLPASAVRPEPDGPGRPIGDLAWIRRVPGGVLVNGWVLDPDTSSPIYAHVYGGNGEARPENPGVAMLANVAHAGVGQAYPNRGQYHAFNGIISLSPGQHHLCLYGINVGPGSTRRADCVDTTVSSDPIGAVDAVTRVPGGIRVQGWALDPDTNQAGDVHVYAGNGQAIPSNPAVAVRAAAVRSDLANLFPEYGPSGHGFEAGIAVGPGVHNVCAYALNVQSTLGINQQLPCRSINVSPDPFGTLDLVRANAGRIEFEGWAIDPDTADSTVVHVYAGTGAAAPGNPAIGVTANLARTDVGAAHHGYGNNHGYRGSVAAVPGQNRVCAYALNVGNTPGVHKLIGCRDVVVS